MEALQTQINSLHQKVDTLHRLVEQMSRQLAVLVETRNVKNGDNSSTPVMANVQAESPLPLSSPVDRDILLEDAEIAHKDVLMDDDNWARLSDRNNRDRDLSPDLQIRRLTAQVTAAYNRIAALEEQLLAQRGARDSVPIKEHRDSKTHQTGKVNKATFPK